MKTTAQLGFILLALTVNLPAQDAAPQEARPNLLPGLPTYAPPPPPPPHQLHPPNNKPETDVIVLPKMTVKQKPRPRLNADIVYAPKDLGDVLARQKYTQLDQALNKFTLPLFGQSLAERAIEEHKREKNAALTADVLNLSKALEQTDPAEAKALQKAVTMP